MKSLSFQQGVKALLVAFCLIGGFVSATETSAQGTTLTGGTFQTHASLVGVDQAKDLLLAQVEFYHQNLANYAPNSPSWNFAMIRVAYFKGIMQELYAGATVQTALNNALGNAATLGGLREAASSSKVELSSIYDEAVQILTQ